MTEQFDLQRFVAAQDQAGTYRQALRELRAGSKQSHWMWYVFPQLAGLGRSSTALAFGISGLAEARAYLRHPVLGQRLAECVQALLDIPGDDPVVVFGSVDALKLRSSMTLFAAADADQDAFRAVLRKYHRGIPDPMTLQMLGRKSLDT